MCNLSSKGIAKQHHYTVYLFDRKKVAPKEYSVEEMADDQFRVLKEIGIEKADFYGVSQGGMIGLAMAIRHPEIINKLVVCSTLAKASKEMLETVKIWSELAERKDVIHLNRAFFNMVCSESYRKQFEEVLPELEKVGPNEDCEHFLTFIKACAKIDLADKLKEIKCPVFVLGDTNDTVLGIEETHRLIKELGCESYIYNEYSHSVYDEAPDIKNRIFEFLKK